MKHLVGKKVVVSVPFLGETVEVVKLSVNQIEAFQASVKALQDSKDEKSGLKIQNDLIRRAVVGAEALTDDELNQFPLADLKALAETILETAGLGGGDKEAGND